MNLTLRPKLKLGTRRSLLAWAQSGWVAREIERANPGLTVELHGIDTRGDKIQDVPLQSVQGKEFFVAELDDALRSGVVDLTVHSLKDLSLERPVEFVTASIPKRENCRDVVLFGPQVLEKIRQGVPLKIGTSSPRRLENIPSFLEKALPTLNGQRPQLQFVEIRGNVNTRLSRVLEAIEHPKQLDAVVLAFAGLIRLWADPKGRVELTHLLQGVRWMILPLRECPTAPGQGALAIECRAEDSQLREALAKIHHAPTADEVARERGLLAEWGGGCHQRFGATVYSGAELQNLFYIRGRLPDDTFVDELRWASPSPPLGPTRPWNGKEWRAATSQMALNVNLPSLDNQGVFIGHSRALAEIEPRALSGARIWTSGVASWHRLAEQGLWIEGCAEGLGFQELVSTLSEPVLRLPGPKKWKILTHRDSTEGWEGQVIPTYALEARYPTEATRELSYSNYVYWSSGSQFLEVKDHLPTEAHHACGPGKTAQLLRQHGLKPVVFPSAEEWKKWLRI